MPLFDFRCENPDCKYEFEQIVSLDDLDKEVLCKNCGKPAHRQISKLKSISSSWKAWRL
jgi:putative FmdB family regulatory protein